MLHRINRTLTSLERIIQEKESQKTEWVNMETAMALLNCKRTKLFDLVNDGLIVYKKVGKTNSYSRKSINQYNETMSTKL